MKRESHTPLVIAVVLLLLPVLYVGSYLALVEPGPINPFKVYFTGVGNYRLGGGYSHVIFWPLEQIDRKVRPGAWERRTVVPVKRSFYGTNP